MILRNLNVALLLVALMMGCGTPQQVAYKTLASVGALEDTAMKSAASAKVAGKITDLQWNQVVGHHVMFQVSYITACDAVVGDINKFAPADVIQLANDVINLVNQLTQKK